MSPASKFNLLQLAGQGQELPHHTYPPNTNYCWTHGRKVSSCHTSQSCRKPAAGHKNEAAKAGSQSQPSKPITWAALKVENNDGIGVNITVTVTISNVTIQLL
jgi:hypothetical protein